MPRHKTAHRKRLEQADKDIAAARAELLKAAASDTTLKSNAQRNAKRFK
jgi:hypothetical protein